MIETPRALISMFPQFVNWAETVAQNPHGMHPNSPVYASIIPRIRKLCIRDVNADQITAELKELSEQVHSIARNILLKEIPELESATDISLGYTGSDARGEKLSKMSPIELVIFTNDKEHPLLGKIQSVAKKHVKVFDAALEVKSLEDNLLRFTCVDSTVIQGFSFPTRILDARYLAGSEPLWGEFKGKFFEDLSRGSKLVKQWKSSTLLKAQKSCRKIIEIRTGDGVDLTDGFINFDGKYVKGVKHPFLRSIQYKVDFLCMRIIRERGDQPSLPRSIAERIDWLSESGIHTHGGMDWNKLKEAYVKLLLIYGASQEHYARNGGETIQVDPDELSSIANTVKVFSDKKFKLLK